MDANSNMHTSMEKSPYLIIPPLFIFMVSMSMMMAPMMQFLLLYVCGMLHPSLGGAELPNLDSCNALDDVQIQLARWSTIISLVTSIPAFISVPFYGILLDRIGRKPLLLIPMAAAALSVFALISMAQFKIGIWILVVSSLVAGFIGSYAVLGMAAFAYIADTTTQLQRTSVFMYNEAAMFVSMALGPILGGWLAKVMPQRVVGVFYIGLVGYSLAFVYVLFLIPESHSGSLTACEAHPAPNATESNLQGSLKELKKSLRSTFQLFTLTGPTSHATPLLIGIYFLISIGYGADTLFFYYMIKVFKWDSYYQGIYMFVLSVVQTAWMAGLFPLVMRKFVDEVEPSEGVAQRERRIKIEISVIVGALSVMVGGYLMLGMVRREWLVYLVIIPLASGTIIRPTLRGLLSRTVSPEAQGQLFAGMQMVEQTGTLIAGVAYPSLWASTVASFAAAFLFVTAGLYIVSAGLASCIHSKDLYGLDDGESIDKGDGDAEDDALLGTEEEVVELGKRRG